MFKTISTNSAVLAISLFGLSACGGSSNNSFEAPTILDGVFKDSNVSGLSFVSGRQKGITDKNGKFTYEEGKPVVFSVGGVELGSGIGKSVMTPLNLVKNASLNSEEVINISRFLMMLDKDNTPSNGIEISAKVQEKAKTWEAVDFKSASFPSEAVRTMITNASVEDLITHSLPTAEVATTHLRTTLLCANAGAYVGEYVGSETGKIVLMVDPTTGKVTGSSYNPDDQTSVEIKSTTPINYSSDLKFVSLEDSAKRYYGEPVSADKIEGIWVDSNNSTIKGTFSANRIGGDSKAVYRYTSVFTGDEKGVYTLDVDNKNTIKGVFFNVAKTEKLALEGEITKNTKGEKLFTATTVSKEDDTEINGKINDSLVIEGLWSNLKALSNGDISGAGCRLN